MSVVLRKNPVLVTSGQEQEVVALKSLQRLLQALVTFHEDALKYLDSEILYIRFELGTYVTIKQTIHISSSNEAVVSQLPGVRSREQLHLCSLVQLFPKWTYVCLNVSVYVKVYRHAVHSGLNTARMSTRAVIDRLPASSGSKARARACGLGSAPLNKYLLFLTGATD